MAKWDNMLKILWMLRSSNMTAEQLAEDLEMSVRTVYRYIDALCASGVPIIAEPGHDGGYSLPGSFKQAPLFFDPAELKAVLHAALFAQGAGYPLEDDLQRALQKIQLYHSEKQPDDWERQMRGMDILPSPQQQSLKPALQLLEKSVADGLTVRVHYAKNAEAEPELRELDPYGLAYRSNKWYIAAYCHRRQDVRTFRVDRMQQLVVTGRTFLIPRDFSVKTYFEQVTAVQETGGDEACFVLIEGTADSLKRLTGHWYLRNCVVKRDGQTLGLRIDEEVMMKYLPSLLLSYTSTVRVLEPLSLKLEIGKIVRELYGFYCP
ncbi:helix-turn-helix transcriptional regulator [Paenibacillus prosopidis]|uniref:Putative DNA-binding transcriptional regulator YafY n=1 Tax=Paenibacillus prosopidis TaxID=630520 RepID=A0A368WAQ0_9BACL|nr:WYL domain-containing protein [Paenibacillus prosopidis]RCW51788.1 putative DNA-binding transcriptional regulator YafY [Paenibacillus prosopidis]